VLYPDGIPWPKDGKTGRPVLGDDLKKISASLLAETDEPKRPAAKTAKSKSQKKSVKKATKKAVAARRAKKGGAK
jgi:hypothetical protein